MAGRLDASVVLACLIVVAGALGVVEFLAVARDATPSAFDTQTLLAFREAGDLGKPLGPHWLKGLVVDFTGFGSTAILTVVVAASAGYLLVIRRAQTALVLIIVTAGGQGLCTLLKLAVARPRPDIVPQFVQVLPSFSFPSGHAMMSAIVYLTLGLLTVRFLPNRITKIYVLALAVLMTLLLGVSRLYLGVHWPSDVLAGWCAGFAWTAFCWLGAKYWLQDRALPSAIG